MKQNSDNLSNHPPTAAAIRSRLIDHFSRRLGLKPHEIDIEKPFAYYGLASVAAISLIRELENWLQCSLPPTLAWDYPSIAEMTQYLATSLAISETTINAPEVTVNDKIQQITPEPVAIIGMSCRFPGGANSPRAFWELLINGVDAIRDIPIDRWDPEIFYDPDISVRGKMITRWGGYLDDLELFDAHFFGISPREAAQLDPRQRLTLETAWEALEDAGIPPGSLWGSQTGVFIATLMEDFGSRIYDDFDMVELYSGTGTANAAVPNRISFFLNLHGPSIAIDTACSGALVAMHLACQSLRNGESALVLAGGVNIILEPDPEIFLSHSNALSPTGRAKTFDKDADGFIRGEGVGIIVLKTLPRALADGDHIYAVIRGSAVNHDGRSNGIMAPNGKAQEMLLRQAYRVSGVEPRDIQYIEAHGTGTPVGDPIEVKALGAVLSTDRPQDRTCILASVKTNLGHLESAAGVTSVIKAALAIKNRKIPPHLHFQAPNPLMDFEKLPFVIPQSLMPWPRPSEPLLVGVSGFGFAGTNVHFVLNEPPQQATPQSDEQPNLEQTCLLPLSAKTPEALRALAQAYLDFLADAQNLQNICYTAGAGRTHLAHRLAVVGDSPQALAERLNAFVNNDTSTEAVANIAQTSQAPQLVFIFSGQGSHWLGMERELLQQEPVFRERLQACDKIIQDLAGWSLLQELAAGKENSRLNSTEITQPAVCAMQIALTALWRSWGIEPDIIVGHSLGEAAAAHVAGALSLEDALCVVYHRSRLIKRVEGQGKAAAVGLSREQAELALTGFEDLVSVAGSNSPTSSLLAGEPDALQRIVKSLESRGVFARMVKIDFAPHSLQMDPLKGELVESLQGIQPQSTTIPILSTVTGTLIDGAELGADYWGRNLREPFMFTEAVQQLVQSGYDTFLEISSHPVLVASIMQGLEALEKPGVVLPSLRRHQPELPRLLTSLGALYTLGRDVDWRQLYPTSRRLPGLPTYPWQREYYWLDQLTDKPLGASAQFKSGAGPKRAGSHPLLGDHLASAVSPKQHLWEMDMDARSASFLPDHKVRGMIVLPGAALVEIALTAAEQAFGPGAYAVKDMHFKQALLLSESKQRVQVTLTPEMPGQATFQVFSRADKGAVYDDGWLEHAVAEVHSLAGGDAPQTLDVAEIQTRCPQRVSGADHYAAMQTHGLLYGPAFQGVHQIWRRDGESLGQLQLPESLSPSELKTYRIHPALLDAGFQTVALAFPVEDDQTGGTFLPVSIEDLRVYQQPSAQMWCHARLRPAASQNGDMRQADLTITNENGEVVVALNGLGLMHIAADHDNLDRWFYDIKWVEKALEPDQAARRLQPGTWLIFTDSPKGQPDPLVGPLTEQGETCILVYPGDDYQAADDESQYWVNPTNPQDFVRLIEQALPIDRPPCRGVIHRWANLSAPTPTLQPQAIEHAQDLGPASVLFITQALAQTHLTVNPRLWLITRQAQPALPADSLALAQTPLWGLSRVAANEHPEFRCSMVDLSDAQVEQETQALLSELWADQEENQIALRGDKRYVARLKRHIPERRAETPPQATTLSKHAPFRLEVVTPGVLDSLTPYKTQRRQPGPGEVEVQVYATGLNFKDVMLAMGILPAMEDGTIPLGFECAGKIVAVGQGVTEFKLGDEVIASSDQCFSRYITTNVWLIGPKPPNLSFEEAATLLVAFGTTHHALNKLAQLGEGERVLIHTASGAIGHAAIQLARLAGAEIFATAGTPAKRDYLRQELGIEHVFDSRSLDFAGQIMQATDDQGVDVVLNTLSGAGITRSISLLKPYGRFLELGKRDVLENNPIRLGLFGRNISFFVIDLKQMMHDRPQYVGRLLVDLWPLFRDGRLKPIPQQTWPISQVSEAFRTLAGAKHIGKLVITIHDQELAIAPPVKQALPIRSDGSYLITGGLGGLGPVVARWLVDRGARWLVLMSRSGAERMSEHAAQTVEELEAAGAKVLVAKGDIAEPQDVSRVLEEIANSMPPLRGVIQSAGVVRDGLLSHMTYDQLITVFRPKIQGTWNLHTLTQDLPLDFFIMFSSVSSLTGTTGQGNYAAANAFIDALAYHRHAQGLPAMTINWGPWGEFGMAAIRQGLIEKSAAGGVLPTYPDQGCDVLDRLIQAPQVQAVALPIDWQRFGMAWPASYKPSMFLDLYLSETGGAEQDTAASSAFVEEVLLAAPPDERRALLQEHLQKIVAGVLLLDYSRLETSQPLSMLGIDSIMALELRGKIKESLGLPVSVADLLGELSVDKMTDQFLPQLADKEDTEVDEILTELEALSDEEQASLLDGLN